ncbi:MAG: sarcosine oxidase subunit gamma [Proteobacteria bacterium]|nr:sarcosine oxidase subunit gamma [Pseudomonadota bacterium]MBI3497264.1 sarcosine oxidase subunit gamma [Pseudomonadota bacterium]
MVEPETPLQNLAKPGGADPAGLILAERRFPGQVILRGDGADQGFLAAAQSVLGVAPPILPNTVAGAAGIDVLWLGPEEWMLVTPPGQEAGLVERLNAACAGLHAGAIDVSDARAVIRLEGSAARRVLAKGTPLDLGASVLGPGRCAQTSLGRATVILRPVGPTGQAYEVHVGRSFAPYLWAWLLDAGREFGVRVVTP